MYVLPKSGMVSIACVLLCGSCGRIAEPEPTPPPPVQSQKPAEAQATPAPAPPPPAAPAAAAPINSDPILDAREEIPVSQQQDVPVPGELRIAMEELSDALRARDVAQVLARFSRTRSFQYADTRTKTPKVQTIKFEQLQRELEAKNDLYRALLEPTGLAQYVSGKHARTWMATSSREFAPRTLDTKDVWVRWRAEDTAWVVDAIGLPAALSRAR